MSARVWAGRNVNGRAVSTYDVESTRRDEDISREIYELEPDATPFLVISNEVASETVYSLEYSWYEDEPNSYWGTVIEPYDGITSVIKIDGLNCSSDSILKNTTTGEIFNVQQRLSETEYKVDRQYGYEAINNVFIGGTQATPGLAGQNIMLISTAMKEGWDAPEPTGNQPQKKYNYVQTISSTISVTEDNETERKRAGGSERARLNKKEGVDHLKRVERACIFGERMEHVDHEKRLTGGVIQFIHSNVFDIGMLNDGILTDKLLERFCEMAFRYGSKNKLLKCSPRVGSIINELGKRRIEMVPEDEVYGLRLSMYRSFHGNLYIATTEMFEKDYQGLGLVLDMSNIKLRYFAGNKSKLRRDIQSRRSHKHEDEVYTQIGTKVMLEKTHAILTGVRDAEEKVA